MRFAFAGVSNRNFDSQAGFWGNFDSQLLALRLVKSDCRTSLPMVTAEVPSMGERQSIAQKGEHPSVRYFGARLTRRDRHFGTRVFENRAIRSANIPYPLFFLLHYVTNSKAVM